MIRLLLHNSPIVFHMLSIERKDDTGPFLACFDVDGQRICRACRGSRDAFKLEPVLRAVFTDAGGQLKASG